MMEHVRSIALTVNGEDVRETVEARTSLVDFLRERLGLTGSHVGCEQGVCGACTVRLDDVTVRGCLVLAVQCAGSRVETIEGVSDTGEIADLQDAFVRRNALQCGFCTPGMLLAAQELLARGSVPSREEIRAHLTGNYCRCTGYQAIVDAIEAVARMRLGPRASRPLPETDHKAAGASSPLPGGGRSARVSGPGSGDSASAHAAPPSCATPPSPHPGSPTAIRPSPSRGGWSPLLEEQRAGRPLSQGAP
ncbi:MAG TPA: 2Fe-2S iron-sulfur cluster-binding protein [Gemmatimonadales bacterium]|nr:2Fe-2S iron-sulfur cluster-binding protein [Gemmatimonadales bacterium]